MEKIIHNRVYSKHLKYFLEYISNTVLWFAKKIQKINFLNDTNDTIIYILENFKVYRRRISLITFLSFKKKRYGKKVVNKR